MHRLAGVSARALMGALRLVLIAGVVASPVAAQRRSEGFSGWTVGPSGFAVAWTERQATFDVASGAAVHAALVRPHGVGAEVRVGYFFPTGTYDLNGISAVLGATYSVPFVAGLGQFKAGVAGLVGGDSDGSIVGGAGPYGGVGALIPLARGIAFQGDVLARIYRTGSGTVFAPSIALGIGWLLR